MTDEYDEAAQRIVPMCGVSFAPFDPFASMRDAALACVAHALRELAAKHAAALRDAAAGAWESAANRAHAFAAGAYDASTDTSRRASYGFRKLADEFAAEAAAVRQGGTSNADRS